MSQFHLISVVCSTHCIQTNLTAILLGMWPNKNIFFSLNETDLTLEEAGFSSFTGVLFLHLGYVFHETACSDMSQACTMR